MTTQIFYPPRPVESGLVKFIGDLIAENYQNRSISVSDPTPIPINYSSIGPLQISISLVLCDQCGTIIKQNYLISHRSSGACSRRSEKKKPKSDDDENDS